MVFAALIFSVVRHPAFGHGSSPLEGTIVVRPAPSGCDFLESSGVRLSEAHCHAGDTSDDIRLLGIRKPANLATRVGIRNGKEMAFADFTPTTNIFLSQLGEIRSGEAFDLLQLLNTGHSGTLSTIHASSAKQGLARFTSCVLQSGVELPVPRREEQHWRFPKCGCTNRAAPGTTVHLRGTRNQELRSRR